MNTLNSMMDRLNTWIETSRWFYAVLSLAVSAAAFLVAVAWQLN